jgi:hypothetical protein
LSCFFIFSLFYYKSCFITLQSCQRETDHFRKFFKRRI